MIYFARDIKRSRNFFLNDPELMRYAVDILMHPEFHHMGRRTAHKHESRQKHLLNVAYYAVKFAKFFNVNLRVVVRASLLHDFYPYQRFKKYTSYREHVKQHPKEALKHAEEFFKLGAKERDIIARHMWPLNKKRPKYKEAVPVMLADNFVAIMENFYHRAWQKPKRGAKKAAIKTKKAAVKVKTTSKNKVKRVQANRAASKTARLAKKQPNS
ncbi:HD domain-containing protein [Candidatus Saccharibacteria bacterium]|nr:HD domain-containing protein [Candidatus Saccharibacteria bacterium]